MPSSRQSLGSVMPPLRRFAGVDRLRPMPLPWHPTISSLGLTEIAIIDTTDPTKGSLSISGQGGFSDT